MTVSRLRRMLPFATVTLAILGLVALASTASAHEHVAAPPLEFIIGWGTEPPIVGTANTIDIAVEFHPDANTTEMVEDVEGNLTVTISTGPASAVRPVEPAFGRPGWYSFAIVPTREGVYTINLKGTINGTTFNVSAQPEEVTASADYEFPVADPTPADLQANASAQQAQIDALRDQVASLNSSGGSAQIDQLKKDNAELRSGVTSATAVGALGVVFGLVGTVVGVLGIRKGRGKS